MNPRILIVEDEQIVAADIESYLCSLGYTIVAICTTEEDAYRTATSQEVDLVLMDIYLEAGNGIDATTRIKHDRPDLPVIFLSGYMDEATVSRAIAAAPESYLLKPFRRSELGIAIQMALHHHGDVTPRQGDVILDDEFDFDTRSVQLYYRGRTVRLTKKERALLRLFLSRPNTLISIEELEYEIWPDKPRSDTRRRSLISRLRTKLKQKFIQTHSSEGYIFQI